MRQNSKNGRRRKSDEKKHLETKLHMIKNVHIKKAETYLRGKKMRTTGNHTLLCTITVISWLQHDHYLCIVLVSIPTRLYPPPNIKNFATQVNKTPSLSIKNPVRQKWGTCDYGNWKQTVRHMTSNECVYIAMFPNLPIHQLFIVHAKHSTYLHTDFTCCNTCKQDSTSQNNIACAFLTFFPWYSTFSIATDVYWISNDHEYTYIWVFALLSLEAYKKK